MTVPIGLTRRDRLRSGRSGRRDNIRPPRATAAPTGRSRPAIRAAPRQRSDHRPLRTAQPPSFRRRERQGGAVPAPPTNNFCLARQALDAVAEQLEPHLAFDAMRAGNGGKRNFALAAAHRYAWVSSAAPSAGSSLDSPSAAASALLGEPSVAGATSSAPSAGASADSPASASLAASSATGLGGRSLLCGSGFFRGRLGNGSFLASRSFCGHFFGYRLLGGQVGGVGRRLLGGNFLSLGRRLLGRRVGGGFSVGSLLRALFDALLGLLARLGLLRVVARRALLEPAASRKRRTRSDGWAPTLSQWLMRSLSSLTRSGESFASSGL